MGNCVERMNEFKQGWFNDGDAVENGVPAYDAQQEQHFAATGMPVPCPTDVGRQMAGDMNRLKKQEQMWAKANAERIARQRQIEDDKFREEARLAEELEERTLARQEERRKAEEEERVRLERAREEQREWEESLRTLDNERDKIRKDYAMLSITNSEELAAELTRMEEISRDSSRLFEEALLEARDAIARAFEEHRRMRKIQMTKLFELIRNEQWSRQAEAQLSNRLFSLKNSHEPVRLCFTNLTLILLGQLQSNGPDPQISYLQAMGELTLLKDELREEITTMNDEVVDMQEFQKQYPRALFLTDIEESAQRVADAASILLVKIKAAEEELRSEPDRLISNAMLNDCRQCFEVLERQVEEIPNVMILKEKYQYDIQ